ncbi:dTDP-4-dehydrorhamnose 3,5-epimerase family protein [Paraglaciecola polaris]|uniref:dTDP-4-dehydrorhamnose 3,5-epimerase family protein n=1 Tax=Paraglaciecola polaris TaxID=222814 RepID=UPI0030EF5E4A|tara:strand:+ start:43337 stop:43792 length:456 start_codon:yes stop_codon:yes gene_type:complete
MLTVNMSGCMLSPLKMFKDERGSVMHFIKSNEVSFKSFAEVYFSTVNKNVIKAWKLHTRMTSNIVVPQGEVRFVLYDPRVDSDTFGTIQSVTLSCDNYMRLTIGPGVWMGFIGGKSINLIANCADIIHDPNEVKNLPADSDAIPYDWSERC